MAFKLRMTVDMHGIHILMLVLMTLALTLTFKTFESRVPLGFFSCCNYYSCLSLCSGPALFLFLSLRFLLFFFLFFLFPFFSFFPTLACVSDRKCNGISQTRCEKMRASKEITETLTARRKKRTSIASRQFSTEDSVSTKTACVISTATDSAWKELATAAIATRRGH